MKKVIFSSFFALIIPLICLAQDDRYGVGSMPFNDRGEVVFSEVIQQEGSATMLYSRVKAALADIFVSLKDVVQVDDPDGGTLVANGFKNIENCTVDFSVKVQTRDGRYRVQLYDLVYTAHLSGGLPDTVWPAEALTDAECINKKGVCKKIGKGFARRCVIDTADWIIAELQAKTAASAPSNDENW